MDSIPRHVAIILDGNGRWAQRHGLPRVFGHRRGAQTLLRSIEFIRRCGVQYLSVFCFSTENWQRPPEEIRGIMGIFSKYAHLLEKKILRAQMRIHWLGHPSGLPKNLVVQLKKLSEMTRHWDKFHLALAINYSGRDEIVRTIGKMAKIFTQKSMENLAWEDAKMYMDSSGMPDIDLLIRTSGEQRLSNFMLLQMAYAELFFTETLWPDFSEETFCHALQFYASRERRFGNITPMGNATSKN